MGGRLDPVQTQSPPPAAVEVKPNAAVEVKRLEAQQTKLEELKWREGDKPPGPDASKADKAAYKQFYDSQTTTNGCSVPGLDYINKDGEGWKAPADVAACNEHDVAYGRGGTEADREAADLALYRRIKANGEPVRAWITYRGVKAAGHKYFTYRDGGPLPIPPGE